MTIKDFFNSEPFQLALTGIDTGAAALSVISPEAGLTSALLKGFAYIASNADAAKIDHFIKGMASGSSFNREKFTNLLNTYVSDEDNAFYVSNLMRKAVLSDSRKVCTIMGRILADNVDSGQKFSPDDIIIGNALQLASDDDLVGFLGLMRNYRERRGDNDFITFPYRDPDKQNLRLAAEWAMNGRILGRSTIARLDGGNGVMDCPVTPLADKLMDYCREVRQIW